MIQTTVNTHAPKIVVPQAEQPTQGKLVQPQVTAREILSNLKSKGSILDQIKAKQAEQPGMGAVVVPDPGSQNSGQQNEKVLEKDSKELQGNNNGANKEASGISEALKVPEITPAIFDDNSGEKKPEVPLEVEPKEEGEATLTIEENLKRMRTRNQETHKELEAKKKEAEDLRKKVEELETGKVIPTILQEKENEIQRLSSFEKIVSLKTSKEYQEAFVKPLNDKSLRLKEIAADYNIPEEVMKKAVGITNRADLNRFLSNHFDDVGALEVKEIIRDIQGITTKAREAESTPDKILADLQESNKRVQEVRNQERRQKIDTTAKQGWGNALTKIHKNNAAVELITKEGDDQRNQVVIPILSQAATEYGKTVKYLADLGVEHIPEELAEALSSAFLYSHAYAFSAQTRDAVLKHADELEKNTKRTNGMYRPAIGGGTVSSSSSSGAPATPRDALTNAQELRKKVMG